MLRSLSATNRTESEFLHSIIEQGGPSPNQFELLDAWAGSVQARLLAGKLTSRDLAALREQLGALLSPATLMGHAYSKPLGYAGDFQLIDKFYTQKIASDPQYAGWDRYVQSMRATQAVRNRKTYFKRLLAGLNQSTTNGRVLDIACGSCRDLSEYLLENPNSNLRIDGIDADHRAVEYGRSLCDSEAVSLIQANALRFRTQEKYNLVWSAGLFDYFDDKIFVALTKKLAQHLRPGGYLVLGNFAPCNPSRPYMELISDWHLHHRSEKELVGLAEQAGFTRNVKVICEPEGINLFLHIRV